MKRGYRRRSRGLSDCSCLRDDPTDKGKKKVFNPVEEEMPTYEGQTSKKKFIGVNQFGKIMGGKFAVPNQQKLNYGFLRDARNGGSDNPELPVTPEEKAEIIKKGVIAVFGIGALSLIAGYYVGKKKLLKG